MRDLRSWMQSALSVSAGLVVQCSLWFLFGDALTQWLGDWGVAALATGLGALTSARLAPVAWAWHSAPLALVPLWVTSILFIVGGSVGQAASFFAVDVAALSLGASLGALPARASRMRAAAAAMRNESWRIGA